jgi:hypothetical protein
MASGAGLRTVDTTGVAGIARRYQVIVGVVAPVEINVIHNQRLGSETPSGCPDHRLSTPVASVRARTDASQKQLAVFEQMVAVRTVNPDVASSSCGLPTFPGRAVYSAPRQPLAGLGAEPFAAKLDIGRPYPNGFAARLARPVEAGFRRSSGSEDTARSYALAWDGAKTTLAALNTIWPGPKHCSADFTGSFKRGTLGTIAGHRKFPLSVSRSGPVSAGAAPFYCTPLERANSVCRCSNGKGT